MIRLALVALSPAAFVLLATPVWAQQDAAAGPAAEPPPRVLVAAGIEWSRFGNAAPLDEEGQTTTGFVLRDSGIDLTVAGEVRVLSWLSVGVAHERLSRIELDQSFDVDGFRNFTTELRDGVFDPSVTELYAAPSWPLGDKVRLSAMLGVGFWRAAESRTLVLLFSGEELSRETLREDHSGTSAVFGAGIDVWLHRRVGVRAGYKFVGLSNDDIDQPAHNLRVLGLFGF